MRKEALLTHELLIAKVLFEIIAGTVYNTDAYVKKAHSSSSCRRVIVDATHLFYGVWRDRIVIEC